MFSIKHKLIAIHSTYLGVQPKTGDTLFTVKSGLSFGTKLTATFKNLAGGGQEEELILRGDMLDRSAEITTKQGVVVARISRSFLNMGEMFCESSRVALGVWCFVPSASLVLPRPIVRPPSFPRRGIGRSALLHSFTSDGSRGRENDTSQEQRTRECGWYDCVWSTDRSTP